MWLCATTLSAYILPKIESGEWKRVLFVPTGALMSTVSYNEGASVPGDRTCDRTGTCIACDINERFGRREYFSCQFYKKERQEIRWNISMHSGWAV